MLDSFLAPSFRLSIFSSSIKSTEYQEVSSPFLLWRLTPAYTIYAFFEWSLIAYDVAFDAVTALDFETFELRILDVQGSSKGYVEWHPV